MRQIIKAVIAVVFAGVAFSAEIAEPTDSNDLSAYYGFGEMEIIKLDWGIKDLRVADFNGDGRKDIAVVNNRKARIELLIQKEAVGPGEKAVAVDPNDIDVNALIPPTRFERHSIAVSQRIYSFVCGDLNSDGLTDLAFYGEPKGLYVILQKASEVESDKRKTLNWQTSRKIKIDDGLPTSNALVCADLNNDGTDDLALAGRDGVYIIIQKKDGTLAEPVKYPTTELILGLEVGDLNGDNINDLLIVTNDSEHPINVRFGLKTGQLSPQVQFHIEKPYTLKLHNIDGQAGDEILTVDSTSRRLMCYKLAQEKRDDSDWPTLFYPLTAGEGSTQRDLVVGDFDGDGLSDVAISDPGAAEIIFYKQQAGLGLIEPMRFPAFADITSLSIADIDNNQKAELAVLSVKEKVIGISQFQDNRLSFPKPIKVIGEPLAMELADIDNDGAIDCLYISKDSNDIRILNAVYDLATTENFGADSSKAKKHKIVKKNSEAKPILKIKSLSSNPDGLKVVDVDQDGLQDILIFVKYELPILIRQTKDGEFEVVDPSKARASLIKDASLYSIAIANVDDKPGKELLVAQKNFARSLVFTGQDGWNVIDQYNAKSTENNISAIAAFHINDKGTENRPEILLLDGQKGQLQILKAGTDKTYRFEKELNVGRWNTTSHLKILFAPLTGNDDKSILLFDGEKFALITPPRDTTGRQYLKQQFSYETKIKDGTYGNLTAGDINSDGQTDIIMVESNRNHIETLALDAEAKPTPAMRFKIFEEKSYRDSRGGIKSDVEPRELTVADVTGDGKDDLVTIIHDRIIIYPQD